VGQQNIFEHAIIGGLLTKLNQMCEKNLTLPVVVNDTKFVGAQDDLPTMNMLLERFLVFYLGVS
jgi:hypothetical protein